MSKKINKNQIIIASITVVITTLGVVLVEIYSDSSNEQKIGNNPSGIVQVGGDVKSPITINPIDPGKLKEMEKNIAYSREHDELSVWKETCDGTMRALNTAKTDALAQLNEMSKVAATKPVEKLNAVMDLFKSRYFDLAASIEEQESIWLDKGVPYMGTVYEQRVSASRLALDKDMSIQNPTHVDIQIAISGIKTYLTISSLALEGALSEEYEHRASSISDP